MDRVELLLCLLRALWGHVTPRLRSVSAEMDGVRRCVRVRFIFDGPPDEIDFDCASCAGAEVIAEFPEGWRIDEEQLAVPAPSPMEHLGEMVYLRWEAETA